MQFVQVLCSFCAATNGLITPFIGQLQRKHSIFIKRYFKIVYIKRVRKVLCFRCFRCSCTLIGLYLLCTACAPHRAFSSFFLNKGKGNRKLSASQRGAARAAGECVPHAAALARLPVKTQEAARREPEQSGASAESAVTTHRGPGAQPRHAFGDFRRETKVTRGLGRSAQKVGAGTTVPHKVTPGQRLAIPQPLQAIPHAAASSP